MPEDPGELPAIPRDAGGPVFRAPWEAQAFAMVLTLLAGGGARDAARPAHRAQAPAPAVEITDRTPWTWQTEVLR